MKHILATLLTVFCLFTAGLVAKGHGGHGGPGASGVGGGTTSYNPVACDSYNGFSETSGDGYITLKSKYPGARFCINNSTQQLDIMGDNKRLERIDI